MRIHANPPHAITVTRLRVRIIARQNTPIAATATKIAVQAPWVEIAFRAIEMPSIPEAATNVRSIYVFC